MARARTVCPECQQRIRPHQRSCPRCGRQLVDVVFPASPGRGRRRRWLLGGLLLALAFTALLAWRTDGVRNLAGLGQRLSAANAGPNGNSPGSGSSQPTVLATTDTPDARRPQGIPASAEPATVIRIYDGDTIQVQTLGGAYIIDLVGAVTPRAADGACFGAEAFSATTRMLSTPKIFVEPAADGFVRERIQGAVWVVDPSSGMPYLVNERLITEGYAVVGRIAPDAPYAVRLVRAQDAARADGRGIWASCIETSAPGGAGTDDSDPSRPPSIVPHNS